MIPEDSDWLQDFLAAAEGGAAQRLTGENGVSAAVGDEPNRRLPNRGLPGKVRALCFR